MKSMHEEDLQRTQFNTYNISLWKFNYNSITLYQHLSAYQIIALG